MAKVLRHLVSIAVLPFTVTVLVPWWLRPAGGWCAVSACRPASLVDRVAVIGGAGLIALGLVLFASSLRRFAVEGDGTLAPWDPPRKFVVTGPYRFVRNPMISGVILILFGEAALMRTSAQLTWAVAVLAINAIYIPLIEEPQLRDRFGESYAAYCRNVRRFLPRLTPWKQLA